ncbi:MAG: D-glycero-beta-D-manno-heptose 1-phosphate adenylyltransferase [bacterium]|nr:D-glycero-beta-D-manno-heptose 1-phosphate adenylyltransferase [bacterium]
MNLIEYEQSLAICRSFRGRRLLVVGDLMLDYWVWGTVSRISPEAPVPVVDIAHHSYTLGGAANVVANLKTLGAEVDMLGVVGADSIGRRLRLMLNRQGIGLGGLIVDEDYPTIMKTRIIANNQQVVRADLETRCAIGEAAWNKILHWAKNHRADYDALVISDYDKGLLWGDHLQELIKIFDGTPIVAGPKPTKLKRYLGCDLITLNAKEAKEASGFNTATDVGLEQAGRFLLDDLQLKNVLITLGERGMALFRKGEPTIKVPALASQVYDVSGAGDTVLSVMALGAACQVPIFQAMNLASQAAAVVVRKVGTATVSCSELLDSLQMKKSCGQLDPSRKILTAEEAAARVENLRHAPNPPQIVFTNGCFDILHVGHINTLLAARREGDLLIVGLNSDSSVKRLKGPSRPINSHNERAQLLAALECVDMVVIFDEDTPMALLEKLRPDVHVKGGDYKVDDLPESSLVKSFGGRIVLASLIPGHSTTEIILKSQTMAKESSQ